jgi:membrane-associated phospholipid phosphatase
LISYQNKIFLIIFSFIFSSLFAQRRDLIPPRPDPDNIDAKIFRAINNSQCGFLNTAIPVFDKSILFTSTLVPVTLFAVSKAKDNYYDENSSVLLVLSEGLSAGVTFGMKNLFRRDRPYTLLSNVHYNKNNFLTDRYSFPSGHTSMSFAMATSLTLRYPDKPILITGLYLYSTVVSLGRIYLGVHYPSDVLAGMLIGSGSAAVIYSFRKEIIKGKNNLFNEKGREDVNSKMVTSSVILTSFIATDILNFVVGKFNYKILNSNNIKFDLRGYENNLNFVYGF